MVISPRGFTYPLSRYHKSNRSMGFLWFYGFSYGFPIWDFLCFFLWFFLWFYGFPMVFPMVSPWFFPWLSSPAIPSFPGAFTAPAWSPLSASASLVGCPIAPSIRRASTSYRGLERRERWDWGEKNHEKIWEYYIVYIYICIYCRCI